VFGELHRKKSSFILERMETRGCVLVARQNATRSIQEAARVFKSRCRSTIEIFACSVVGAIDKRVSDGLLTKGEQSIVAFVLSGRLWIELIQTEED
jgi:hypothetical protein